VNTILRLGPVIHQKTDRDMGEHDLRPQHFPSGPDLFRLPSRGAPTFQYSLLFRGLGKPAPIFFQLLTAFPMDANAFCVDFLSGFIKKWGEVVIRGK
jgi:hypothetical protein